MLIIYCRIENKIFKIAKKKINYITSLIGACLFIFLSFTFHASNNKIKLNNERINLLTFS